MFDIEIAGQMSAWFLDKQGGEMPHVKLMELLYLAERTSIQRDNEPILGDSLVSMRNGPILSRTLDFMQGEKPPGNGWDKWVSPKENHKVSLAREFRSENLDLLSESAIEILEDLWEQHTSRDEWEIVDYTHEFCREWRNPPRGSSSPISYKTLLSKGFGYDREKAEKEAENLLDQRELIRTLYELSLE